MQAKLSEQVGAVGYLAAVEQDALGFFGALLLLGRNARPIEFHCTHPLRPKPAQRVLYGATLHRYLLAEQIPRALLNRAKAQPEVLLVQDPELIHLREQIDIPLALINQPSPSGSTDGNLPDSGEESQQVDSELLIGQLRFITSPAGPFAIHQSYPADREPVELAMECITRHVDLDEPFERLQVAMEETVKSLAASAAQGKPGSETSGSFSEGRAA